MLFRLFGLALTLAIVGYLFATMNKSDSAVSKAVNNNASVQEQKKTLQDAGVDTSSDKAMTDYAKQQAQAIKDYQDQAPPKE